MRIAYPYGKQDRCRNHGPQINQTGEAIFRATLLGKFTR
jgi:hypothetical protein